jgi:NADH-quinone oxidoreductase subunit G
VGQARKAHIPSWHDAAVRELGQSTRHPIHLAVTTPGLLEEIATEVTCAPPEDLVRLALAVAHAIDDHQPEVESLAPKTLALANRIADDLRQADEPVIVADAAAGEPALLDAAGRIAAALAEHRDRPTHTVLVQEECNAVGVALLDCRPLDEVLDRMARGEVSAAVVVENDLFRRASAARVRRALRSTPTVVLDHVAHDTGRLARLVLPAAPWVESTGTFVNNEGRAQRHVQVSQPEVPVQASWRWIAAIAHRLDGEGIRWQRADDALVAVASEPGLNAVAALTQPTSPVRLPRDLPRFSGRTALHADESVREPRPPADPDTQWTFSMEGYVPDPGHHDVSEFWAPRWNSIQSLNRFQEEVGGPRRAQPPDAKMFANRNGPAWPDPTIPPAFAPREDSLRLLRRNHVFGSEELSRLAPSVRARSPRPVLAMHPDDLARFEREAGQSLDLEIDGITVTIEIVEDATMPPGAVALGAHLSPLPPPEVWPSWVTLKKESP